jgi:PAS domain S-box-containing protein
MNAVSEDLTGWKQDEAEGKQLDKIFNIVNEKTRLSIENPVDRVLREGKITALENHTLLIQKNGAEIPIDDCAAPIRSSDVLNGAVLVFRDITERYRAERERVVLFEREQTARAQAEAANTAKDEFLAIVSHELRTPLSAILGWARLLSIGKLDGQATHDAIDAIEQSAKAQAGLIEDLLDVSRIMSGKLRIKLEPVKLESVIEAALDTVRPAAEAKSIHLEAKLDAAAGAVLGDATRLQQVIWNLLSNAVKFTPKDGHVYVRLERAGSHAQLTVTDTGQGIKGDFLPHVFERFKQADSTDTRQHGGLGLGLAIVRSLVEMHGGTVTADSRGDGLGATFTLRFPVSAVEASIEMPVEKLAPMPSLSGLHVLVVDDDPSAREMIAAVLTLCGAHVTAMPSAAAAMEAIQQEWPDVLVSDIGMPAENGYEFIAQIRKLELEHGKKLPAVALTAFARTEDRLRALTAGFHTHVPKPADPTELALVIASISKAR